jgi:hypothetical protein
MLCEEFAARPTLSQIKDMETWMLISRAAAERLHLKYCNRCRAKQAAEAASRQGQQTAEHPAAQRELATVR